MNQIFTACSLCPRDCKVNRSEGKRGYCGQTAELTAARAALHMWEEPCISGEEGSGTVFFSGCPVRCVFCQNRNIAVGNDGKVISIDRLAEIFLELQEKKANNINLVTPTHYVPQICLALDKARADGLNIPVVYNTGGYEKPETIKMLEGYVDVYLPDFKYISPEIAARYSHAADYARWAKLSLAEMVRQAGETLWDDRGIMKRGVIVRHLVLPGCVEDSKAVMRYLYETYGNSIWISIMNQYTPLPHVADYPEINRALTQEEYDEIVDYAIDLGVEQGFIQEGGTVSESFIPSFDNEGI